MNYEGWQNTNQNLFSHKDFGLANLFARRVRPTARSVRVLGANPTALGRKWRDWLCFKVAAGISVRICQGFASCIISQPDFEGGVQSLDYETFNFQNMDSDTLGRRKFLQELGTVGMLMAAGKNTLKAADASSVHWPRLSGSPVLDSLRPVIEHSRDVQTHFNRVQEVAGWMAYEELPMPDYALPLGAGDGKADETIDFILTADCVDTAFTDFSTHEKFQVDYAGRHWSDSDALFACMKRALDDGIPMLDGRFLARVSRPEMERIFAGNIELPMLDQKMEVLHQVGTVLAEKYDGRFHNFVRACSPRLYDNGNGLVDRLVKEFARFNDVSEYDGHTIKFYKLPQLGLWFVYSSLRKSGQFHIEDLEKMTAFADYMVPVALRLMGMTSYSSELEHAINTHQMIPRDSRWEVEIRAHCVYATALLCEEINKIRPKNLQIIIPQIDARLWTHYHTTWWPHHLTKTIMY